METTTWLLFGAMKLDDVKELFNGPVIGIGMMFFIIGMVMFTIYLVNGKFASSATKSDKETVANMFVYKKSIILLYLFFFFFISSVVAITTILPSTKQALALITVDLTLKNKDSIVSTGQDVLNAVDGKVEKYLRILTKSELPIDKIKDVTSNAGETLKKGADTTKKVLREANEEVKALVATGKEIKELIN